MNPILSIVTGTRHRPDSYQRFIESVRRTVTHPYEIVVGDANDCPIEESYAQPAPDIKVCYQRPRMGMVKGYNNSFRHCSGEWVVWFNDDCECLTNWDTECLNFMRQNPEIGIGAIYFLDRVSRARGDYLPPWEIAALPPVEKSERGWGTQFVIQTLYGLPYANFGFLKRSLGNEVGWFPEDAGRMYGCDCSISWKILERGLGIAGIAGAKVLHHRKFDEERSQNRDFIIGDRELFDQMWDKPRLENLREIMNKFPMPPKAIP